MLGCVPGCETERDVGPGPSPVSALGIGSPFSGKRLVLLVFVLKPVAGLGGSGTSGTPGRRVGFFCSFRTQRSQTTQARTVAVVLHPTTDTGDMRSW